jgi:Tfp pilus assembly protein PilF
MKKYLPLLLLLVGAAVWYAQRTQAAQSSTQSGAALNQRESLYRDNNLGVALMEQFKHEEAAKAFRKALAADAKFALARINLSLALFFLNDSPGALKEAQEAVKLAPENLTAQYALGLALRSEKLYDEAIAAFNQVLAADSQDAGANVQVGQLYAQKQQYEPAIKAFRAALAAESYNQTAAYSLAQALIRSGNAAEGQQMLAVFQKLKASGYATSFGNVYGEKGRYGEGVVSTGAESEFVSQAAPQVKFTDATAEMGLNATFGNKPLASVLNRKVTKAEFTDTLKRELVNPFSATIGLPDIDADGRLDVFAAGLDANGKPFVKLFKNTGGKFTDVTEKSKLTVNAPISGAVFGDFNNDNTQDALLFGYNTLALWTNNGDATFSDVTAATGLPTSYSSWAMTAAFLDADHDGDLDLFIGNFADLTKWPATADTAVFPDEFAGSPNRYFRNNGAKEGKWSFTDATDAAGLGGGVLKTTAVVCTDYDNRRDIDFFIANYGGPSQLFANQRDGSFKAISAVTLIADTQHAFGVGAGDLNKDGYTDFYLPGYGEAHWKVSDGRGGFRKPSSFDPGTAGISMEGRAVQLADFDNDGMLDVVESCKDWLRVRLYRPSYGKSTFDHGPGERTDSDTRAFALGDLNSDGVLEVLTFKTNGAMSVLRHNGASKNYAAVNLTAKTSNRSGIGTKAVIRSGSLSQKLESYASSPAPAPASMIFGLGFRTQVDTLNLIWPAGIVQSELAVKANQRELIEELDRKGTSCPLLYTWNGSEYQFVTDFLGGSAIGYRVGGGKADWNYPDTDEYVLVTGEQLQVKDGRYSLRMNNQLEEVIYFDAVKLLAVDHPAETAIYPNERLMPARPYPAFKIYSTRNATPPVSARDETGRDVLSAVSKIDRSYPDNFAKLPFKGYASEHSLTLDLGKQAKDAKRVLLLLSAWIDYADSTSNLAASQAGVKLVPPYLQTRNAKGEWVTTIAQMGFPAGLTKTMTVELPKDALCNSTEVRIVTSMRIYWDQVLVDVSNEASAMKVTTLQPLSADLHWRGFPREFAADDKGLKAYDYRVIEAFAPWKAHLGNYTRYGDVRPLLSQIDDMYVVTRNGDEMQIDFDATKLPVLPQGWRRDFLVFADGFGKDMDINSARPDTIGELPYHAMKSYPYASGDTYPNDASHQNYLRTYNTRTVREQHAARWQATR